MYRNITDTLPDYDRDEDAAGRAAETRRQRLSYLRRWSTPLHGHVVELAPILAFIATPGWKRQHRASAAGAIRSWLRWNHRTDAGFTVPDLDRVPCPTAPRGTPRPLNSDMLMAALAVADDTTTLMILLGREAGLRRAEIAQVRTDDLLPGPSLVVHGKGGRDRVVPVSAMLADHIARRPAGWLFPSRMRSEGHIEAATVTRRVKRAMDGAATTHRLRHTFASEAYATNGHDIIAVQRLLGHSMVATTQNYVDVPSDVLRASVEAASIAHAFPQQRDAS